MATASLPRPETADSRALLQRASESQQAGEISVAGVLLSRAVHCRLSAMAEWNDCLPEGQPSAVMLARALRRAQLVDVGGFETLLAIIDVANGAACSAEYDRELLRVAIDSLSAFVERYPCR